LIRTLRPGSGEAKQLHDPFGVELPTGGSSLRPFLEGMEIVDHQRIMLDQHQPILHEAAEQ
jgi:hypothetical protein